MLVGREQPAAAVAAAVEADAPVVVIGDAGIGKTTLVRAVLDASDRPALTGGALSTLSWMPLLALERAIGAPLGGGDREWTAAAVEDAVGSGVLFLDDLQWAHTATVDAVVDLAGRVAVVAAVRDNDAAAPEVLERLRAAGFTVVEVGPLDDDVATEVVGRLAPGRRPADVAAVVAAASGNPLLLEELATADDVPESLALAVGARVRGLSAEGRRTLALVVAAGGPVPVPLAGDGLAEVVARRLASAAADAVHPAHGLLVDLAARALDESEVRDAHRRLAEEARDDAAAAARHWFGAGDLERAGRAARAAAEAAAGDHELAEHLRLAAACTPPGDEANRLLLDAAAALDRVDALHTTPDLLDELDVDSVDPGTRAVAAVLRAKLARDEGRDEDAVAHCEDGLAGGASVAPDVRVELLLVRAYARQRLLGAWDGIVAEAEEVAAAARAAGHRLHAAEGLLAHARLYVRDPSVEATFEEMLADARAAGDPDRILQCGNQLAVSYLCDARLHDALILVTELHDLAVTHRRRLLEWRLAAQLSDIENLLGRPREALRIVEDAVDEAKGSLAAESRLLDSYVSALSILGRNDEAEDRLLAVRERSGGQIEVRASLADVHLSAGRPAKALELLDELLVDDGPEVGEDSQYLLGRAWALADTGKVAPPDCPPPQFPLFAGIAEEVTAIHLLTSGRPCEAADAFALAAATTPAVLPQVRCRWAEAEARRRCGDVDAAVDLLTALDAEATERGFVWITARIRQSLRAAGVSLGDPTPIDRSRPVSAREHEVLQLVATGATNAEIAVRLGVSRRTIESHIDSARLKLGAANRAQAAAMIAQGARTMSRKPSASGTPA